MALARVAVQVAWNNALTSVIRPSLCAVANGKRTLYSREYLKLDEYARHRSSTQQRMGELSEKFKTRMDEYMSTSNSNSIFTEDLRTMLHLVNSDEDLNTTINMIKRFNQQSSSLQLSSFTFGPVIMRMLYTLGKPAVAFELFNSPGLDALLHTQMTSLNILMDLLYENGMHNEVLAVYDTAGTGKPAGSRYMQNLATIALASCYKLNTPDSFQKAKTIVKNAASHSHGLSSRGVSIASALALNQNNPSAALEIIQLARPRRYQHSNIRVKAFISLNRLADALPVMRFLVDMGSTRSFATIFSDVLAALTTAVEAKGTEGEKKELLSIKSQIEEHKLIRKETLEDFILAEIIVTKDNETVGGEKRRSGGEASEYADRRRGDFGRQSRPPRQREDDLGEEPVIKEVSG